MDSTDEEDTSHQSGRAGGDMESPEVTASEATKVVEEGTEGDSTSDVAKDDQPIASTSVSANHEEHQEEHQDEEKKETDNVVPSEAIKSLSTTEIDSEEVHTNKENSTQEKTSKDQSELEEPEKQAIEEAEKERERAQNQEANEKIDQERKDEKERDDEEKARIEQEGKDEKEREDEEKALVERQKKEAEELKKKEEQQQQRQQQRERLQKYNSAATTEIVQSLFGPSVGPCWGDFSCQHNHVRGRLYASAQAVLFYSNLFGFEKRLCLKYEDVVQMQLYRATSIQISVQPQPDNNNNEEVSDDNPDSNMTHYIFKSFSDRGQVLQLLIDLWKKSEGEDIVEEESSSMHENSFQQSPTREAFPSNDSQAPRRRTMSDNEATSNVQKLQQQQSSNPVNPPSILKTPTVSSNNAAAAANNTTSSVKRQLSSDTPNMAKRRRARSLPPPQRQQIRVDSESAKSFDDSNVTAVEQISLDQKPSEEDLASWNTAKKSADPCVKERGIDPTVLSCSLDTFYNMFLANDAEFSMDKYMESDKVQDLDVRVSPWAPDATEKGTLVRTIEFRHPVSQSFGVGPSHAPTKKRQRLRRYPGCGICIQSSSTVEGLPGADCFVVEDHWLIERLQNDQEGSTKPQVTFSTQFGARFTKRSFLKGMIQKSIRTGTQEWFEGYLVMIQSALGDKLKLDQESLAVEEGKTNNEALAVGSKNDSHGGVSTFRDVRLVLVALSAIFACLFVLLLVIFNQLRTAQRTTEHLYEELKELRLEQGRLLSLLLEQQQQVTNAH